MILGLGIDLVEINRIKNVYQRFGHKFCSRVLTPFEIENISSPVEFYLAARFAAKEALVKALGTGFTQGITFQHIEIQKNKLGQPSLHLSQKALQIFKQKGGKFLHCSLTHSQTTAGAVVIIEA